MTDNELAELIRSKVSELNQLLEKASKAGINAEFKETTISSCFGKIRDTFITVNLSKEI